MYRIRAACEGHALRRARTSDFCDLRDKQLAEVVRFSRPDAVHAAHGGDGQRFHPRQLAKRRIVKNDIWRNAAGARDL
jgi:hypothetical protein